MVQQAVERAPWQGRGRLDQLVAELDRQKNSRIDFVADGKSLQVQKWDGGALTLAPNDVRANEWLPKEGLPIGDRALAQLGGRVKPEVPVKFLRELAASQPAIARQLLDDLLHLNGTRHFVRALDGRVRAILSNSYRVLDNFDLAFNALEAVRDSGGEVIEATLSETNMRLKFTTRNVWDTIAEEAKLGRGNHTWIGRTGWGNGDKPLPGGEGTIHPIVTVSNSETGNGGLSVQIGILRAYCVNTAILEDVAREIHLGGKLELGIYSQEAIAAESKAVMLKSRDAIKAAFNPDTFKRLVAKAKEAQADTVAAPSAAVANIVEVAGLNEAAKDSILAYFLKDYDPTRYGLAQAVSRYSQDTDDADVAHDLETLAGKIIANHELVAVAA